MYILTRDSPSFGCGVFYRDRSYNSNAMTALLFLLTIYFLENLEVFFSKLATVLVV